MRVSRTVLGEHCGEVPLCYSTLRQRNQIKYDFIAKKKKTYPIDRMCQLLEVKRSGYYRRVKKMKDDIDPIHS
jgi:DNA polymerase/3'-5' exonuclease PolX